MKVPIIVVSDDKEHDTVIQFYFDHTLLRPDGWFQKQLELKGRIKELHILSDGASPPPAPVGNEEHSIDMEVARNDYFINWMHCDTCEKWRKLEVDTTLESTAARWTCSYMNVLD